ncbi:MAG TPA: hypothetical protein VNS63_11700 [Blastocatellia bacterium]|nr:hypothetical protein [Blastocatellia bacterium]
MAHSKSDLIHRFLTGVLVVAAIGVICVPSGLAGAQVKSREIWSGSSAGFTVRWTSGDITAVRAARPSRVVFSAKSIAQRKFLKFKKENTEENTSWLCSYTLRFKLLSLTGSILSYEETESSYCGTEKGPGWAHPSDQTTYRVLDLNQVDKPVRLTDYFSESEILRALLADPLVGSALKQAGAAEKPASIGSLLKLFSERQLQLEPQAGTAESPKECTFIFPEDPLTQFAFHHTENDKVAVRLSLDPASGACRTAHAELGILLPISNKVAAAIAAANSGSQGFLMKDSQRLFKGAATTFEFKARLGTAATTRRAR